MILMIDNERRRARLAPRFGRRFGGRLDADRSGLETLP
jgi:hypothetical protein